MHDLENEPDIDQKIDTSAMDSQERNLTPVSVAFSANKVVRTKEMRALVLDGKIELHDARIINRVSQFLDGLNDTDGVKNLEARFTVSIANHIQQQKIFPALHNIKNWWNKNYHERSNLYSNTE